MSEVRMCPSCAKEMEYDSLTGRFVCTECGRSERAEKDPYVPASTPKAPVTAAPVKPFSDSSGKSASETPVVVVPPVIPKKTVSASPFKPVSPATQKKRSYTEALEMPAKKEERTPDTKRSSDKPAVSERRTETPSDPKTVNTKTDPYVILHAYAQDFECDTVEEALVQSEKLQSTEYLDLISTHDFLVTFREVLPKSRIPQNINAYCAKMRQIFQAEETLRESQNDLKMAEQYVKGRIEREKHMPKVETKKDYSMYFAVLVTPLVLFLGLCFGRRKHTNEKFIKNASEFNTLVKVVGIMYVFIFVIFAIMGINYLIRNRKPKVSTKLVDTKRSAMDDQFERIYKLQKEKEEILKDIRNEENSIRAKYMKRSNR